MFKAMPSLLITVEDSGKDAQTIQKGCLDSGRFSIDPTMSAMQTAHAVGVPVEEAHTLHKGYVGFKKLEGKLAGKVDNPGAVAASIGRKKYGKEAFQQHAASGKTFKAKKSLSIDDGVSKALSFIIHLGGLPEQDDPTGAYLKDTHGEQFSPDADRQVVEYLTTVEKIDLQHSPTHNPVVVPGPELGFPHTRKSLGVLDALETIEKSVNAAAHYLSPMARPPSPAQSSKPKPIGMPEPTMAPKPPTTAKQLAAPKLEKPRPTAKFKSMSARAIAMTLPDEVDVMAKAFEWEIAL